MELIGNTEDRINWAKIIDRCNSCEGTVLHYNHDSFPNTQDFQHLDQLWQQAGYCYNDPSIEWINYFPEDFGEEAVAQFQSLVKTQPWMVWISRIRPGKMAPWHYDAHQNIHELKSLGNPVRYTCYIQTPHHGHVSIVDNTAIYMPSLGSIYKWPAYDAWHCGLNGGLTDKYLFNYWGYE